MVFVCPTKEDSEAITQMSQQIKEALKNMDQQLNIGVKPICVPCCVPLCDYPSSQEKKHENMEFKPPQVMVCYKEPCKKQKNKNQTNNKESEVIRLHQSKSRELRASILYTGCLCEKRDGLQDDCPRTGCHGSPECLTNPPTCGPSEFSNGKHLGKKNQYNYLHKTKNDSAKEKGEGNEKHLSAKYKCYPATIEKPIIIPMDSVCCPCDPVKS